MQAMRLRHSSEGSYTQRALPLGKVAGVTRFVAIIKGAVALMWYATIIVAPFWLLKIMIKDLFE